MDEDTQGQGRRPSVGYCGVLAPSDVSPPTRQGMPDSSSSTYQQLGDSTTWASKVVEPNVTGRSIGVASSPITGSRSTFTVAGDRSRSGTTSSPTTRAPLTSLSSRSPHPEST